MCHQHPSKYTCPGCNKRTCSLACVRDHKRIDHCTGVRDRTKFVPISEYNDAVLHDDYFFLTDVARKVDSTVKSINDFPAWSTPHMVEDAKEAKNHRVSSYLSALIKQAADRHVQLITLPLGMSRQVENKSRYIFGKGLIMWYAKWNLASIAPILSFSTRCSELDVVGEVFQAELSNLSSHLYPLVAKYKTSSLDQLILLMEKYIPYDPSQASHSSKEYYIVPHDRTFRDILAGTTLLEFPVFYAIFPSDLGKFSVRNLPLVPLPPWQPPQRSQLSSAEKRMKVVRDNLISPSSSQTDSREAGSQDTKEAASLNAKAASLDTTESRTLVSEQQEVPQQSVKKQSIPEQSNL
ncbi:hypothetical protein WA538_005962 [Blastocystis sp. DL]